MLKITSKGSFNKTDAFLQRMSKGDIYKSLSVYAQRGVDALSAATPSETGETANSWDYEITNKRGSATIWWTNRHVDKDGTPIAIMLQFGHGTGTGGYIQGRDYINPAIRPIFDQIANDVWKEVTSS
jgi:hypothetical protein